MKWGVDLLLGPLESLANFRLARLLNIAMHSQQHGPLGLQFPLSVN